MASQKSRQLDWMDNLENMRPLRGGRPAAAVLASANPNVTVDEAKRKFEENFANADMADDPLDVMINFVHWFQWNIPSGRVDILQPMVYRILTKYGTDPRYRNDERTMKLWLTLADNFPERGFAVMDLACSRGSCKELAKFYIFWSKMYEYAEQMNKAREILSKGINNRAAPINELYEASDELEVRILRWTIEKEKRQSELDLDDDSFIEHCDRQAFNELEPVQDRRGLIGAPIVRVISAPPPRLGSEIPTSGGSFEVFADYEEDEPIPQPIAPQKEFPELSNDPDYQSIFGYKEFPNPHVNITKNSRSKDVKENGIPGIVTPEQPLASFVVYYEAQNAQKLKLKFAIKRELVESCSIEEAFLSKISENFLNNENIKIH